MANFERAESPPPESILTTEKILERPPRAPARKKTRTRRNIDSPTRTHGIFVPRTMSSTSSIYLPWTTTLPDSDQENESGFFNLVLPSWRLNPRRRLSVEDANPVSADLVNTLRPIALRYNSTIYINRNNEQEGGVDRPALEAAALAHLYDSEGQSRRILPRDG